MSAMSELDSDKAMKLLMLRLDAIEHILIEDLKIPKERMEEVFMNLFYERSTHERVKNPNKELGIDCNDKRTRW